jgi:hypothetical protein
MDKWIAKGLLSSSAKSGTIFKFSTFNSSITIENINFTEISAGITTTNALFFPYYSPFTSIKVVNCSFDLLAMLMMTLNGANFIMQDSYVDVVRINRMI